jgi:hypothetical protein
VPVVENEQWTARTDRLVLLFEASVISAEEPGFYLEDYRIVEDPVADFEAFYKPINRALI